MDLQLTDEQRLFRDTVHGFAAKELLPLAAQMDREARFPEELWQRFVALGLLGVAIPEEYGGSGGSLLLSVLLGEEISWANPSVGMVVGAHGNLCALSLYRNGNEEQRKRYLPKLCRAELIGAMALTEPDQGSDAVGMKASARRDGDTWVLKGSKMLITNAPFADLFLVYVKTNPEAGPFGISAFLVEKDMPGVRIAEDIPKMGLKGSPTGGLYLDDARVPAENLLGEENNGIAILMGGLDVERMVFASMPLGMMRRCLELCLDHAKNREQFGRPIAKFQLIQAKLADMYTRYQAAASMVYRAARHLDSMERGGKGSPIHTFSAAALLFAAEVGEKVAYDALQIFGGWGYTDEYEVSRIYRDIRLSTLGAGTSEIRRLIIARELLGV